MTKRSTYLTLRPEEKETIQRIKQQDPRFADDSRIADGSWLALVLTEYEDELTEDE